MKKLSSSKLPDESFLKSILSATAKRTSPLIYKRVTLIKDKLNNDVYKVQSGRARSSIQGVVKQKGFNLYIAIFSILSYIFMLENGYKGKQDIRKHNRNIRQAFGRRITPMLAEVREHKRQVNRSGRPFFYNSISGLDEEVKLSIDSVIEEFNKKN